MRRVFLTVLDGVGVGYLPDADKYGDVGACTLGHVVDKCSLICLIWPSWVWARSKVPTIPLMKMPWAPLVAPWR